MATERLAALGSTLRRLGSTLLSGLRDLYYTLCGLGYVLIAYAVCVYAVIHYACWTLPRCAWLRWTGQIPPPSDPGHWTDTNRGGKN